ncbi:hypothetical protein [Lysinibacillus pakistanensis]|uniref:Uncharacterized protein n=1 Tax=Lysinibacillus pakistanensis TaxID=759811 RepID=A0AAX3X018_9BACI|nr:hypothetical protein [Lysinibacillus pakistanensis]MDM5231502.1 hypothetical protein [Lysinibacillus pakistanensis]WHY47049.1 hypothetical protein QNH22_02175 [Lysinibacillus pakistanensis]WHY52060.1 hypothetical protein QNH24_02170 [Lysinibacillus pakistanensis]
MRSLEQRRKYIQMKMIQHESITDVHKYQRRLKRLMRYHKLLTNLEVKQARENLRKALK